MSLDTENLAEETPAYPSTRSPNPPSAEVEADVGRRDSPEYQPRVQTQSQRRVAIEARNAVVVEETLPLGGVFVF